MNNETYLRTCQDCNYQWVSGEWNIYCSDCRLSHRLGITKKEV